MAINCIYGAEIVFVYDGKNRKIGKMISNGTMVFR